ncbi:ion channel [Iningainema tapete]|uniref:ATP-sensitive inward rectifier potassium channel 10 n=1 Tax=Iningainema tapete BLCC-T55 TaxID=2748662 RepID=A0A8J7C7C2_9CYAN|nr:ion channel [Iningainema tapete]MBD2772996.1 ATP-sensitive inward rectifier potassium channel 10 [Iningainema tapete BLCC-T55]
MKRIRRKAPPPPLIMNRDGGFNVVRKGTPKFHWGDLYHLLLTLSWPKFLALVCSGYFITNALFALAYIAAGDGIANARPGNFLDAFFFSVQTMATIGYGAMYPKTAYANALVTAEALLGLLGVAMATGLMFARFSIPRARVLFSRVAVITPYNGMPTLMFRVGNERENWILEAQLNVTLVRSEITLEKEAMRRFFDLQLVRKHSPLFALTWTVMHTIDESSPLYGLTPEMMLEDNMEIVVTFTGLDETVSQTIHARHSYISEEIFLNMRFVDILSRTKDGRRCIDFSRFHDIMPLDN